MIQREILTGIIQEKYPRVIMGIEIGTLRGDTIAYLLKNIPNLEVYCIDPTPVLGEWAANINDHNTRVHILELPSDKAARLFDKESFDFVWVDGDHSYEQVKRDIVNYLPLVRKGGFIGGHDYGSQAYSGVKQAVDELFNGTLQVKEDYVWVVNV